MYKIKYDILLYILLPNIWILIWKIFYPNPTPIGRSNEYPAPGSWPVTFFFPSTQVKKELVQLFLTTSAIQ